MKHKIFSDRVSFISVIAFSFLLSLVIILNPIVDYPSFTTYIKENIVSVFIKFTVVFVFSCVFVYALNCIILSKVFNKVLCKYSDRKISNRAFFIISFSVMFAFWFIYFLVFFPGILTVDGRTIINSPIESGIQHPIVYNLLVSGMYNLGLGIFNGDAYAGLAFCVIIQMIFVDVCISFFLLYFYIKNFNKFIVVFFLLYFALLPIMSNYVINIIKDTVFGISVLFMTLVIYETVNSNGEFLKKKYGIIEFILVSLFVCFMRNNGKYVVVVTVFIMIFLIKNARKYLIISLIAVFVLSSIPNLMLSIVCKEKNLKQEALCVPIQQVGLLVCNDKIEDIEDKEFLSEILDFDIWKRDYDYKTVDTIKWNDDFNRGFFEENYLRFLKIWLKYLPKNMELYVKAHLLCEYGYWSFGTDSFNHKIFWGAIGLTEKEILPANIRKVLQDFYLPLSSVYPGSGTCFFVSVLFALLLVMKKKYKCLLVFLPATLCWATLIVSAPIAYGFRYTFYYVLCLPLFLLIILNESREFNYE